MESKKNNVAAPRDFAFFVCHLFYLTKSDKKSSLSLMRCWLQSTRLQSSRFSRVESGGCDRSATIAWRPASLLEFVECQQLAGDLHQGAVFGAWESLACVRGDDRPSDSTMMNDQFRKVEPYSPKSSPRGSRSPVVSRQDSTGTLKTTISLGKNPSIVHSGPFYLMKEPPGTQTLRKLPLN